MDLGSILLILSLVILVGIFVSRPFFEPEKQPGKIHDNLMGQELSALYAERDRIINALQELDFDAALGKIPSEEYPLQRRLLIQRGANVLYKIDTIQENVSQPGHEAGEELSPESMHSEKIEARLEAAVAKRRADGLSGLPSSQDGSSPLITDFVQNSKLENVPGSDDEIETLLANRRRKRNEKASGFCPKCGTPTQQSDRFCPKCGRRLV